MPPAAAEPADAVAHRPTWAQRVREALGGTKTSREGPRPQRSEAWPRFSRRRGTNSTEHRPKRAGLVQVGTSGRWLFFGPYASIEPQVLLEYVGIHVLYNCCSLPKCHTPKSTGIEKWHRTQDSKISKCTSSTSGSRSTSASSSPSSSSTKIQLQLPSKR